jgi:hypothetical protein
MRIKGISEEQIVSIAKGLGLAFKNVRHEGNYTCGVLRMAVNIGKKGWRKAPPEALRYRKRSYAAHYRGSDAFGGNGAVCFHGHKRFMEKIFEVNPGAIIRTKMAAYRGIDSFNEQWPRVGSRNVGSMMYPLSYQDACNCGPETTFGTLHSDGSLTNVRRVLQSDMLRCPHAIFDAAHYRDDGSCKCNDPEEQARMIREWGYRPSDFQERSRA